MYRNKLKEDYKFIVEKNLHGGYEVLLPHQCDEWKVLGFDGTSFHEGYGKEMWEFEGIPVQGTYPANPTSKEAAVSQMQLFVQRAQEALETLKNLP